MNAEIKARILGEAITIADELFKSARLDEQIRTNLEEWLFSHVPVSTIEGQEPELNRDMFVEMVHDAIRTGRGNIHIKTGSRQTGEVEIRDKTGKIKFTEKSELEIINGNSN
jgi:hypothetical protein